MSLQQFARRGRLVATLAIATVSLGACGMIMHRLTHGRIAEPAPSEFGLGPRASATGAYIVTVETAAPLATRRLQTVHLRVVDRAGRAVRDARITVDGGMPQHGHGLPTRPRVAGMDEAGRYVVQGVRFNMGGWWELRFAITGPAGADSVTFNIRL